MAENNSYQKTKQNKLLFVWSDSASGSIRALVIAEEKLRDQPDIRPDPW